MATLIKDLTPAQYDARFPVGTRVMTGDGEQTISRLDPNGVATEGGEYGEDYWRRESLRPIVTLGSLNVSDEFRWHDETPGAGVYRVKSKSERGVIVSPLEAFTSIQDCVHSPSLCVQVTALNLAQDRPEVFPGSMLREGDVVEMHPDPYDYNDYAPFVLTAGELLDKDGDDWTHAMNERTFRLVPATIPAPAPTEPCPAPEPSETEQEKPEQKCDRCGVPESKYTTLHVDEGIATFCDECFPDHQQPDGTFLPPKPPRTLPPTAAYHLNDDCDASGLPGWN